MTPGKIGRICDTTRAIVQLKILVPQTSPERRLTVIDTHPRIHHLSDRIFRPHMIPDFHMRILLKIEENEPAVCTPPQMKSLCHPYGLGLREGLFQVIVLYMMLMYE